MKRSMFGMAAALAIVVTAHAPGAAAQDAAAEGAREFRTRCATCHSTDAGQNRVGPHLFGVFDRPAGSVEGARYSSALKGSGIVWDEEALDTYLADPRRMVPGTSMPIAVPDHRRRALLIEYLRGLSPEPD